MKKVFMVIIALFYSFISVNNGLAANVWTRKADFGGGARSGAVGFSIGSKGYIGTGAFSSLDIIDIPPTFFNDFWEYDPATDTWSQKADFGGAARASAVGFSIGNKGYIGTGVVGLDFINHGPPTYNNDFWEYDPTNNTWTRKADFGGGARYNAVGFSIGNNGYIGTGFIGVGSTGLKDFWEYEPATNTWTQRTDFGGIARGEAVGFSIGSKGYIGTGNDIISSDTKDFWEYDPALNTWTQKADFGGTARVYAVGFSIESKGYIGTGNDIIDTKDFWEYDPALNTWTQNVDFGGTGRFNAIGFSIGNKGYIGTGHDISSPYNKNFWEYGPIDTTPDQFTFTDQTGVAMNTVVTSNTITVSGINAAAPISVSGGTYAINGGSYTSASGTVNNGDTVTVQLTSSGNNATTTNATLTIGGVSGTFSVTTQAAPASSGGSGGGGCFIATAAFGSPLERHVQILRDFRDRYLLNTKLGQKFVKLYYQISPPIAGTIAKSEALRMFTRWCLMPVIGVAYLIVMFGVIPSLFIITISFLMMFYFVWLRRKRFKHDLRCSSAR
jgi:hypothetical protein